MDVRFDGRLEFRTEIKNSRNQKLAELMAREACRVLEIEVPRVRFFYRTRLDRTNAYTEYDGEICIADDLSDKDTCSAVLHECRHLWQAQRPEW